MPRRRTKRGRADGPFWNNSQDRAQNGTRPNLAFASGRLPKVIPLLRDTLVPHAAADWHGTCFARSQVFDPITSRMEQYLDLLSTRQKLVASNIANLDTPGYRSRDIDFQFEFESQLAAGTPSVYEPTGLIVKNDGNNVDLDREARLLAENAMRFNLVSNLMKNEIHMVKTAIEESKS